MVTTVVGRLDYAIKGVAEEIAVIEKQMVTEGLSEERETALRKLLDTYSINRACLEDRKTILEGCAPSGNPTLLSQGLHALLECESVVSLPLFCLCTSPPLTR
jgi:hypothetical protein